MKVLLATDGSEAALRACRSVVPMLAPDRDSLRLITVLSYTLYPYSGIPDEPLADEAEREQQVRKEIHRITDEPRRTLEEGGFNVDVAHRFGNPTEEIVAEMGGWNPRPGGDGTARGARARTMDRKRLGTRASSREGAAAPDSVIELVEEVLSQPERSSS